MSPRSTSRGLMTSTLIAAAGLLGVVGATRSARDHDAAPWFAGAGIALTVGLVVSAWPDGGRVSPITRIGYIIRVRQLKPLTLEGWQASNVAVAQGTLLAVSSGPRASQTRFLCEVLCPLGSFFASSDEATKSFDRARQTRSGGLELPQREGGAMRLFPEDFSKELPPSQSLPTGRYHAIWWTWVRESDGVSVRLRFVASTSFRVSQAGFRPIPRSLDREG
jgi:hypothetical protein